MPGPDRTPVITRNYVLKLGARRDAAAAACAAAARRQRSCQPLLRASQPQRLTAALRSATRGRPATQPALGKW